MRTCCRSHLTFAQAQGIAKSYFSRPAPERQAFLLDALCHGATVPSKTKPLFLLSFRFEGTPVLLCQKATSLLLAIDRKRLATLRASCVAPYPPPPQLQLHRTHSPSAASLHMLAWLTSYVNTNSQPDPSGRGRHMPARLTLEQLYKSYLSSDGLPAFPMSVSSLDRMLSVHFPDLRYPRVTRLGKCDLCFDFDSQLRQALLAADRVALLTKKQEHLLSAATERTAYAHRQRDAANLDNCLLSLAVDGARDLLFPHEFPPPRKFTSLRVPLRLYGSICHSFPHCTRLFLSPPFYSHNVNYVITVLALELHHCLGLAPHVDFQLLTIQMDNCWRENKNRYVFGFLAILLFQCHFKTIDVHFLPTGHTHDDQDAVFGKLSQIRDRVIRSAPTWPDLLQQLTSPQAAGKPPPFSPDTFVYLGGIYDWRAFLEDHCAKLANHSFYRSFRFQLGYDGSARMIYRRNDMPNTSWHGSFDNNSSVLIMVAPPTGQPVPVSPLPDPDLEKAAQDLTVALPSAYTPVQRQWLSSFAVSPHPGHPLLGAPPADALCLLSPRQHPPPPPSAPAFTLAPLNPIASSLTQPKHAAYLYQKRAAESGDLVLIRPNTPADKYWMAVVTEASHRSKITVKWYQRVPESPEWTPTENMDTIPRASVLISGFMLQADNTLSAAMLQLIDDILRTDAAM